MTLEEVVYAETDTAPNVVKTYNIKEVLGFLPAGPQQIQTKAPYSSLQEAMLQKIIDGRYLRNFEPTDFGWSEIKEKILMSMPPDFGDSYAPEKENKDILNAASSPKFFG